MSEMRFPANGKVIKYEVKVPKAMLNCTLVSGISGSVLVHARIVF